MPNGQSVVNLRKLDLNITSGVFFLLNYENVHLGYSNSFHSALGTIAGAGRNLPFKQFNLI